MGQGEGCQVIDTTKLAGQLSVVQELPEVSKLVFQEVKQETAGGQDSIVNILENMKTEQEPGQGSVSPLDYTVSVSSSSPGPGQDTNTPLNLAQPLAKGVKRVVAPVQHIPHDTKRLKQVYVVSGQHGQQQILQELPTLDTFPSQPRLSPDQQLQQPGNVLCLDPLSPGSNEIKKEPKSKSTSPKISNLNKSLTPGSAMPSSKTCNWVFENGQVCGKTFSKSYNLVVHMRMHEDIRPFACTLCDQTFRQKAHLQRHETTHGIQSKNIYRQPAAGKKKKKKAAGEPQLSKGLQNRLAKINQNLNKANGEHTEDSAGEDYMEEEEEDLYVPNGHQTKVVVTSGDGEHSNGFEAELESEEALKFNNNIKHKVGDLNMNIINAGGEAVDDDTSAVQDILHTVNSVPTLEQSLYHHGHASTGPSSSLPHITKLVESTSITSSGLPSELAATPATHLPGTSMSYSMFPASSANSNILFTTLSAPAATAAAAQKSQLSFIETSVPGGGFAVSGAGGRQVLIDSIEEHSPEIQAEILNALLADQTGGYVDTVGVCAAGQEELWEEEIYRLTSLPPSWWVSRKRRSGTSTALDEVSYYSPEGYCFKTRAEIQDFLATAALPKELRTEELRSPPLPIDQIPVIEETYQHRAGGPPSQQSMDTNSIAQALIANLKPEPLESLKEALSNAAVATVADSTKISDRLSLPPSPAPSTCSSNVMTLSTVS